MSPSTPEPAPPLYQTDLAQTPLPEILAKVDHYKVPGRLECRRGGELKQVYFERGEILVSGEANETFWSIFEWDGGTVSFTPGREKHLEFVKVGIPIPQAILRGVRRMPDARALLARIGSKTTVVERTDVALAFAAGKEEQALLAAVNGKRTLYDIVNLADNPADNARLLYGLFVLGLIRGKIRRPIKVRMKTRSPGE